MHKNEVSKLDIVLERILSLLPKKPDGSYMHGAKKDFATNLGLAHNLITMWEKGQSSSYKNYLYEIAAKYDVSVDWLQGKTDIKKQPADGELTNIQKEAWQLLQTMTDDQLRAFIAGAKAMLGR